MLPAQSVPGEGSPRPTGAKRVQLCALSGPEADAQKAERRLPKAEGTGTIF